MLFTSCGFLYFDLDFSCLHFRDEPATCLCWVHACGIVFCFVVRFHKPREKSTLYADIILLSVNGLTLHNPAGMSDLC